MNNNDYVTVKIPRKTLIRKLMDGFDKSDDPSLYSAYYNYYNMLIEENMFNGDDLILNDIDYADRVDIVDEDNYEDYIDKGMTDEISSFEEFKDSIGMSNWAAESDDGNVILLWWK